jgi:hypothetical protein
MMLNVLRRVLGVRDALPAERAVTIARETCQKNGWEWREPILLRHHLFSVHVMTNADAKGGNVNIWIDVRTGAVLKSAFASR